MANKPTNERRQRIKPRIKHRTDIQSNRGDSPPNSGRRIAQILPLKRLGTVAEVARVAAFLLSDAAAFVNGAVVPIDGGKLAGIG